ncbi:MAG: winged helix-turn-helix transcriptional regulator [Solirubrobacterales bacterium]|nr:winged helix-turn-helix transcriptional regulator [Solirubrobacterales bacterium]
MPTDPSLPTDPSPDPDPRLEKALGHPLRVTILEALKSREATPAELARELGEPVGVVTYHCLQLGSVGALERSERPQQDRTEVFFRATPEAATGR